jgi:hypothetical protein
MAMGTYPPGIAIPYRTHQLKFYPLKYSYPHAGTSFHPYPYPHGYFYPSGNPYPTTYQLQITKIMNITHDKNYISTNLSK